MPSSTPGKKEGRALNAQAERHLAKAENYLGRGDEFYAKAADEIIAARDNDMDLTWADIAARVGRSYSWCRRIVRIRTKVLAGEQSGEEVIPDWHERGSHATTQEIETGAGKLLTDAPMEQVERIIGSLSEERKLQIAAAAGDSYSKLRQRYEEQQRNLTPAERSEREAAGEALTGSVRKAMAGFNEFGIVNSLEMATEVLKEMISDDLVTPDLVAAIDKADAEWRAELEVARAMIDMGVST